MEVFGSFKYEEKKKRWVLHLKKKKKKSMGEIKNIVWMRDCSPPSISVASKWNCTDPSCLY